jgi:hypothetical protein
MHTVNEIATLYALKDKEQLREIFYELQLHIDNLNNWFDGYIKSFSDSEWSNAPFNSDIRKPYNEKFDQYEDFLKLFRVARYYLEKL